MKRLAIVVTHPIQYYVPVFELLSKKITLKVFYTRGDASVYDHGFKKEISWDIPLLKSYDFEFLENTAKYPGTHHYYGITNPTALKQITNYDPSAILIYGWSSKSHLKIIRHFGGKIPIYFRGDSTLLDSQNRLKGILKTLFLKWVYQHIDCSFYVGKANKAYFKYYGLEENQLVFAPHAVDNLRFSENRALEASDLRSSLAVPKTDILILYAGKFEAKKNPEILLEAFTELNLPNMHLLFVGNGKLEDHLKRKANELSAGAKNVKIHFMDFQNQSQMPVVYQACDLFNLPSQGPGETWGLAINEAMAAGKAVLVSDKVGSAADLVKPMINGDIFKSGDLADLKQKLNALTESKVKLAKMGVASRQMIQNWSFEKQVEAIIDTINSHDAK